MIPDGNATGGQDNYDGLIYAGAQCHVDGNPILYGQLICKDNPNPPGSIDWVTLSNISGQMTLRYRCGGLLGRIPPMPVPGRKWSHVW